MKKKKEKKGNFGTLGVFKKKKGLNPKPKGGSTLRGKQNRVVVQHFRKTEGILLGFSCFVGLSFGALGNKMWS